jgi:hypothetical protein
LIKGPAAAVVPGGALGERLVVGGVDEAPKLLDLDFVFADAERLQAHFVLVLVRFPLGLGERTAHLVAAGGHGDHLRRYPALCLPATLRVAFILQLEAQCAESRVLRAQAAQLRQQVGSLVDLTGFERGLHPGSGEIGNLVEPCLSLLALRLQVFRPRVTGGCSVQLVRPELVKRKIVVAAREQLLGPMPLIQLGLGLRLKGE